MEIINIVYSCGHEEECPYTGNPTKLKAWKEKTAESSCTACQIAALYEAAKSYRLPKLEGSPAQVKWALEIRQELYTAYRGLYEKFPLVKNKKEERQKLWESIVKAYDLLHSKDASFFIEHRNFIDLLEYHKVVNLKKRVMEEPPEGDLFSAAETDEDLFKDNEEYRFD